VEAFLLNGLVVVGVVVLAGVGFWLQYRRNQAVQA